MLLLLFMVTLRLGAILLARLLGLILWVHKDLFYNVLFLLLESHLGDVLVRLIGGGLGAEARAILRTEPDCSREHHQRIETVAR